MSTKEGLEKLKLKYNTANGWKYGGGARKRVYIHGLDEYTIEETSHSKYYENHKRPEWLEQGVAITNDYYPKHKDECICEHHISENCYIYKKEKKNIQIRVIGNCCIKKFGVGGKRCKICDTVHKNRKDNYCNSCRKDVAEKEKRKKQAEWYCSCGDRKKNKSHPLCVSCYYRN
jgi:hypothetical protein